MCCGYQVFSHPVQLMFFQSLGIFSIVARADFGAQSGNTTTSQGRFEKAKIDDYNVKPVIPHLHDFGINEAEFLEKPLE